ncbi:MAG: Ig-like domain-containing protein [Pseudolactococcus laudensis]
MLGIVIVLLSLVNTSSVALAAPLGEGEPQRAAKDWGDQFITNAELQDSAGQVKESFGMYDDMRAQWNFKIPAGTIIQPGDTMTLKVPEVLGLGNSAAFGINDEQGNTIGNAQVSPTTGDIVITFTDAITEAETAAINGQFYLGVKWVEVKVSFDEKVEIK